MKSCTGGVLKGASQRAALVAALALGTAAAIAVPQVVWAEYPDKPIRILVPAAPGAATDITARLFAEGIGKVLKQSVTVENQAGGAGNIALGAVARAAPDGYTLAISSTGFVSAPFLFKTIPYDPEKSFEPVSQLVTYYNVLVTRPDFPGKTLADYLARVRSNPGGVSLGSGNIGGQAWIMTAKLNKMANININYIPYKGSGPALVDAMGNHLDSVLSDPASLKGLVQEGKLRAVAVTSPKRSRTFPDAPAIAEQVPGYQQEGWIGLFAPAGTPKAVIATLQHAVARVVADPAVRQRLTEGEFGIVGSSPEEFAKFLKGELVTYGGIIKDAKLERVDY